MLSLKQRILILILTVVTLVWLTTALVTYFQATHEVNEILDAHLAQTAALLILQDWDDDDDEDDWDTEHTALLHKYSRRVAFQLWKKGSELIVHSANVSTSPLSSQREGFSDTTLNQQVWRVFSAWDTEHEYLIQVAELMTMRQEVIKGMTQNLTRSLWVALPVLALLVWWSVGLSLRPLAQLAEAIARRDPHQLEPIVLAAPREVKPLLVHLNALFSRIQYLLEHEKRFTADAAHELRTPIAGIQAQLQVAQNATQDTQRHHALSYALQGCQRATHLIEQLLTLARLESNAVLPFEPCELRSLALEVLTELAPEAYAAQKSVELLDGETVAVQGISVLLQVLMRNIVDNAIRYTPPNTHISVTLGTHPTPYLTIADNGLGLADTELKQLKKRFYRVLGNQTQGSGLGLSIVERIAEIHHAQVTLNNASVGQGLVVKVSFQTINQRR